MWSNYVFIFFAIVNLIVFTRIWNIYDILNPFVSLYLGIFFFVIFGGFYDGFGLLRVIEPNIKIFAMICFYLFLTGGILSVFFVKNRETMQRNLNYCKNSFVGRIKITKIKWNYDYAAYALYILGIILTLFIYSRMSQVPLFSSDVHTARVEELKGNGIFHKISLYSIYVSLIYFAIVYLYAKKISKWKLAILILIPFILLQGYAIRADCMKVIVFPAALFLVKYLKPSFKSVVIGVLIFSIFFGIVAFLQFFRHFPITSILSGDVDITAEHLWIFTFSNFLHRFWVQLDNIEMIFNRMEEGELLGETYINDFLMLLPGDEYNKSAGVILKERVGESFVGGGITPTMFGEAYANFGYGFACFLAFVSGFFTNLIYLYFNKLFDRIKNEKVIIILLMYIPISVNTYGIATATAIGIMFQVFFPAILATVIFLIFASIMKSLKS